MKRLPDPPTCGGEAIRELRATQYFLPTVLFADEHGVFALLAENPLSTTDVAEALGLRPNVTGAVLGMLASLGLLAQREGRFCLTPLARTYLVPESPFYSVGFLAPTWRYEDFKKRLEAGEPRAYCSQPVFERSLTSSVLSMGAFGLAGAMAVSKELELAPARSFLDVAGGAGMFSIALASRNPNVRFTVMERPEVVLITQKEIERYGFSDRIKTLAVDMFAGEWPVHDVVFLSNVCHNWDQRGCGKLFEQAFSALPTDGRIMLNEVLLSDTKDGPIEAVAYSLDMVLSTEGRQYSASEFATLLRLAGFHTITIRPVYAFHSIVEAVK